MALTPTEDPLFHISVELLKGYAMWVPPRVYRSMRMEHGGTVYGQIVADLSINGVRVEVDILPGIADRSKLRMSTLYHQMNVASVEAKFGQGLVEENAQFKESFLATCHSVMKSIATRKDFKWILFSEDGRGAIALIGDKILMARLRSTQHPHSELINVGWLNASLYNNSRNCLAENLHDFTRGNWCAHVSGCVYTGLDKRGVQDIIRTSEFGSARACSCQAVWGAFRNRAAREDFLIALCMGQHARLGVRSPFSALNQNVLEIIADYFLALPDNCGCHSVYDAWRSVDPASRV